MAETDFAYVIGVRTYPEMGSLRGPCHDAAVFRDWLLRPDGGNVPEQNVRLLVTDAFDDPDSTDHPYVSEIEALFADAVRQGAMAANGPEPVGRRVYIYMAGHGFSEAGNMTEVALLGANAGPFLAPHIAATRWAEWFRANGVFDEIVLIMDCCRTTSPISTMAAPPLPRTMGSRRRSKVKRFYAYAVTDGEAAREELGPDGEWGGIFTRALLEAFDAALPDKTGRVHGTALANYVHQRVGDRQAPDFEVPERHDIVFAERQGADLLCARLRLEPFGGDETVVVRDSRREVARTTPDRGSFGVELEAGLYKAIVEGTDRATLFEVPGEEVVL